MSIRQYANKIQIKNFLPSVKDSDLTDATINQAEAMIDQIIAEFGVGNYLSKAFTSEIVETVAFTNDTAQIPGGYSNGYFTFCNLEILTGNKKGLIIPITGSINNILSFDTIDGLVGNFDTKISQIGKFPMVRDQINNYKVMPNYVTEALAYQVDFLIKNKSKANSKLKKSESIGSSYSYTLGDKSDNDYSNRIAPLALEILKSFLTQSV